MLTTAAGALRSRAGVSQSQVNPIRGNYEHWLTALQTVLAGSGLLSESTLDERTKAVLATQRDASHQHAHREPVAVDPPVR